MSEGPGRDEPGNGDGGTDWQPSPSPPSPPLVQQFPSFGGYGNAPPPPFTQQSGAGSGVSVPPWASGLTLAGYGSRVAGYLLDGIILGVIGMALSLSTHAFHTTYTTVNGVRTAHLHTTANPSLVIEALVVILYGTVFLGSARAQTPGMMAARIRVVSADGGGPIGYGRALGRAAFAYVLGVLFVIPLIVDLLFPLWDARKQTLHDKIVNAVVVRIPRS